MYDEIIKEAKALCEKFINKVETGRAHSRETYAECKALLKLINENNQKAEKQIIFVVYPRDLEEARKMINDNK